MKPPIAKLAAETIGEQKEAVEVTSIFGSGALSKPEKSLFGESTFK